MIDIFDAASLVLFYISWMLIYSLKKVKEHKINNFRRNLLTFKTNAALACSCFIWVFLEQANNWIVEYLQITGLDAQGVFLYWFYAHLLEKILFFFCKTGIILFHASTGFPEFNGYVGKRFPGQDEPRPITHGNKFNYRMKELGVPNQLEVVTDSEQ